MTRKLTWLLSNLLFIYRRNFNDIVELLTYDYLDSSSSDSSDDDLCELLLETAFAPKQKLGPHLNLQDISDDNCENMFRYT